MKFKKIFTLLMISALGITSTHAMHHLAEISATLSSHNATLAATSNTASPYEEFCRLESAYTVAITIKQFAVDMARDADTVVSEISLLGDVSRLTAQRQAVRECIQAGRWDALEEQKALLQAYKDEEDRQLEELIHDIYGGNTKQSKATS